MPTETDALPDEDAISRSVLDRLYGFAFTQAVAVFADLGIAAALTAGPLPIGELAERTDTDPEALRRLLRLLALDAIVVLDEDRVALGTTGRALARPNGLLDLASYLAAETYESWSSLGWSVRTGRPAFDRLHGSPYFEWLANHEDHARRFDEAMGDSVASRVAPLLARPWIAGSSVIDVGGGSGALISHLRPALPEVRWTLFDLPQVISRAKASQLIDLDDVDLVGGDFLRAVPAGFDLYLLAQVLHDWPDRQAIDILRSIRAAMPDHGRVLVLESLLDGQADPRGAATLDLNMLVMLGGCERTLDGYRALASAADLQIDVVVPGERASLIELVASR